MSQIEYNDLLFEIAAKIDVNELPRIRFMCRDKLPGGGDSIPNVLALFEELERRNHLGIDRLDTVKEILDRMKKRALVKKVEDFERRRKAQSAGIISSLKRGAEALVGAVKLRCNLLTLAGGIVVIGTGLVLRSCSSFEEYCDAFNKVVLPAFSKLVELREGSLCFTVQAETVSALSEVWKMYNEEILKTRLQQFLVTEEVKQLANGKDVELTVFIDDQEYKDAYLGLMLQQNRDVTEEEEPVERRRRTSDSFLFLVPKRDTVTMMKLQLAENKLVFEREQRKAAEQEIMKLKFDIEKLEVRERENIERPRVGLRRNSDSELYCKAKYIQIRDTEKKRHLFEDEKYAFVQRYLENVQERQSTTTETSDSGVKTHGTQSELGAEDIPAADETQRLRLRHLRPELADELQRRIDADTVAARHICQSLGFTSDLTARTIFLSFPDTPLQLLRDVFEALELLDLAELLDKEIKSFACRSLRAVLTWTEMKNTDSRPVTFQSKTAVLILTYDGRNPFVTATAQFFEDLNLNSSVSILMTNVMGHKIKKIRKSANLVNKWKQMGSPETDIRVSRLTERLGNFEKDLEEVENTEEAASVVIDEWILCQDDFSLFAVFDFATRGFFYDLIEKLALEIPSKPKLIVTGRRREKEMVLPETLLVTYENTFGVLSMRLAEILKKRWPTQNLASMMSEFKRTVNSQFLGLRMHVTITDTLSSLVRFKREEELS